jgi:hypothetical protein
LHVLQPVQVTVVQERDVNDGDAVDRVVDTLLAVHAQQQRAGDLWSISRQNRDDAKRVAREFRQLPGRHGRATKRMAARLGQLDWIDATRKGRLAPDDLRRAARLLIEAELGTPEPVVAETDAIWEARRKALTTRTARNRDALAHELDSRGNDYAAAWARWAGE